MTRYLETTTIKPRQPGRPSDKALGRYAFKKLSAENSTAEPPPPIGPDTATVLQFLKLKGNQLAELSGDFSPGASPASSAGSGGPESKFSATLRDLVELIYGQQTAADIFSQPEEKESDQPERTTTDGATESPSPGYSVMSTEPRPQGGLHSGAEKQLRRTGHIH
jgi:hypothetical protein